MSKQPNCANCLSTGWVCENHPDRGWDGHIDHPDACGCGAGMPCKVCNEPGPNGRPRMAPGVTIICGPNGWVH